MLNWIINAKIFVCFLFIKNGKYQKKKEKTSFLIVLDEIISRRSTTTMLT